MERDLQEIIETHEIRKTLGRYARGIDRADLDLIKSAFHQDCNVYHRAYDGPAMKFAELSVKAMDAVVNGTHLLGHSNIEFDGEIAYVETYFLAHLFLDNLQPPMTCNGDGPFLSIMSGRYVDRFEKRSAEWKIAERKAVVDWNRVTQMDTGGVDLEQKYYLSEKSVLDPSYFRGG